MVLVMAFLATSVLAGGCAGAPPPAGFLVPQQADLVASVRIGRILADPDLAAAYDQAPKEPEMPQTLDEALDMVVAETGIDPRDFSEAVIFGDLDSEQYFAAIITGTFDPQALIAAIEQASAEMEVTQYGGYDIYRPEGEGVAVCFLSDDSLVIGFIEAVKDVIDVQKGAPCLSGPLYDAYNSLGDVWIKVAVEVPEGAIGEIPEEEIPIDLEAFEDLQLVGFGFNKVGQTLSAQLKLYFSTSGAAADAEGMISSLISLLPVTGDLPPEVVDLLDGLNVSRSDSCVTISLQTTVTEIENLVEAMQVGEAPSGEADLHSGCPCGAQ